MVAIVAKTIGIDPHNHLDVPLSAAELPGPAVDLAGELRKSGLSAICLMSAVDYQQLRSPGEAHDRSTNGLAALDEVLVSNNIKRALSLVDPQAAQTTYQPNAGQSVEGAHFLEGKLERLGAAY